MLLLVPVGVLSRFHSIECWHPFKSWYLLLLLAGDISQNPNIHVLCALEALGPIKEPYNVTAVSSYGHMLVVLVLVSQCILICNLN